MEGCFTKYTYSPTFVTGFASWKLVHGGGSDIQRPLNFDIQYSVFTPEAFGVASIRHRLPVAQSSRCAIVLSVVY
jgi:hypothetical protein